MRAGKEGASWEIQIGRGSFRGAENKKKGVVLLGGSQKERGGTSWGGLFWLKRSIERGAQSRVEEKKRDKWKKKDSAKDVPARKSNNIRKRLVGKRILVKEKA